jgi:amidase
MDATDLAYAGAAEQARMVREGEVSARELVEATLDRIERLDPQLNAFRVVFAERALDEAERLDSSGAGDRPLAGVPVAIKDDADVAGEVTAWGGTAHAGPRPVDSDVVARLREAGAIVVGKTNVPELTIWPFTETVAFGATRNPWNTQLTPGGSSGGSGAAVAAGLCGVALGSDGAGSIRIPAAFCGLFGIKPQRDRISLGPDHHDAWHGLSVYGPIARSVADAALFLDATADGAPAGGYAGALSEGPGRLRIAISTDAPPPVVGVKIHPAQRRAIDETASLLRELGHEVREREVDYGPTAFLNVTARYLRGIHDDAKAMAHPERLENRTQAMARRGGLIPDSLLAKSRAGEAALAARINKIFDDFDVVLMPGPSGPPFRVGELQDRGATWALNASVLRVPFYGVWNATGQPATSVPAGFDEHGAPTAVQFGGRVGDELTLLRLAAQIEAARPWAQQRPPLEAPAPVAA